MASCVSVLDHALSHLPLFCASAQAQCIMRGLLTHHLTLAVRAKMLLAVAQLKCMCEQLYLPIVKLRVIIEFFTKKSIYDLLSTVRHAVF